VDQSSDGEGVCMTAKSVKVGVVGCGNISGVYFKNARRLEPLDVVACADSVPERAARAAADVAIPRTLTTDELLADPEVEIVLNLTPPKAHAAIAMRALEHGKSVYNEKPLATCREDGRRLLEVAEQNGLRIGCAPDTFLGAGLQTARKVLDEGVIGRPVAAMAFVLCHGHESWHPDPAFLYQPGGGPLFDMGPYYLTALVTLLGPVQRVCGAARISFPQRTITSEPKRGQRIRVEVPTHVAGVLEFASGVIGTIVTSYDVWHAEVPFIELYGETGSLSLPDPNTFGGPLRLRTATEAGWEEVPLASDYCENWRGLGLADMAGYLGTEDRHRASGELAYHVLDIMEGLHESAERGEHLVLESTCDRPAPLAGR
jgi:predicted dehydrogenase